MDYVTWMIFAVLVSFSFGSIIFYNVGKGDGMKEALENQQKLENTKMWTEVMNRYMGGKHE